VTKEARVKTLSDLTVKIFADGADLPGMRALYAEPFIRGFTTNPTLMRKAGVTDYEAFAREAIASIPDVPISFEVFSDTLDDMEREARIIASWGGTTYIKIPISDTRGESTAPLIRRLSGEGLSLNITAILTLEQVRETAAALEPGSPSIVSVFAGRIADTGVDPLPVMREAVRILEPLPRAELLWASPREVLNGFQADECGCHIITATSDILSKLSLTGKDLGEYSLETVRMFYTDAQAAGYKLL